MWREGFTIGENMSLSGEDPGTPGATATHRCTPRSQHPGFVRSIVTASQSIFERIGSTKDQLRKSSDMFTEYVMITQ